MKTGFIPVAVVVHFALPLIVFLSMRKQHSERDGEAEIFRYAPGVAWLILLFGISIATITAGLAWAAPRGREIPMIMLVAGEAFGLTMVLYNIYLITMRITVIDTSFTLTSAFRKQTFQFENIGSATDRLTGKHRTLEVRTKLGKRALYLDSTFIADYALLADLLQYGVKHHAKRYE